MKPIRLTATEISTLIAAIHYAIQWEESFMQSLTPRDRKPKGSDKESFDRSRRLIQRMEKLRTKLRDAEGTNP